MLGDIIPAMEMESSYRFIITCRYKNHFILTSKRQHKVSFVNAYFKLSLHIYFSCKILTNFLISPQEQGHYNSMC